MLMKNLIILCLLTTVSLFSCSSKEEQSTSDETSSAEEAVNTETVSQLEKEHSLYLPGYADSVNLGLIPKDTLVTSARREATQTIGNAEIKVNYGSPGKRGRVIWNGLVSYDQVWVSGSHWATAVTFSKDVKVDDTVVPAGTYAFFTIPGRQEWTLILNKNYDQHLAEEYNESEDVVRINVNPETTEEVVQRLTYEIEEKGNNSGAIVLKWDQTKLEMPFEIL
jgi:hypothetical protein